MADFSTNVIAINPIVLMRPITELNEASAKLICIQGAPEIIAYKFLMGYISVFHGGNGHWLLFSGDYIKIKAVAFNILFSGNMILAIVPYEYSSRHKRTLAHTRLFR